MKTALSPWVSAAQETFSNSELPLLFWRECQDFTFHVHLDRDSLWLVIRYPNKSRIAFRAAYSPNGELHISRMKELGNQVAFHLKSIIGDFTVKLIFCEPNEPLLHYTTSLKPSHPLLIPFSPRDIIPLGENGKPGETAGEIHVNQTGLRSGMLYMSMEKPKTGSVFYFQNLGGIGEYCQETETSAKDTVGGQWPEMGFALPTTKDKPLPAGKEFVISDAFIFFTPDIPADEFEKAKQFLDMHARIYVHLPQLETTYPDWLGISKKTLKDIEHCPACWSHVQGNTYLNAYVSGYKTPPESMVQLAVLLPLMEYAKWCEEKLPLVEKIERLLPNFFDEKIGCVSRWLPAMEEELDGSEEHKKPRVMDSWYLHHPLLNLSRIALFGDKTAKKLFLDSMDYVIKVAHHFKYKWPVFYNFDTLEVIKAETKPGMGGEQDVAGSYAHIMLQAWKLTKEKRYLEEAKKAAKSLQGLGFDLFYQANNTAFAAGAMLDLWKETKDELYLNLSYLCLANLFKNIGIWECKYGHGKYHPTSFGLFPLNDAPYTAVYEEQEAFAAFNYYLAEAKSEPILPSVILLLSDFIRLMTHKAVFYYPPLLPKDMFADECTSGELDLNLWIPYEDLQDGWEKCAKVGQEVYGAGQAFGFLARQYKKIPGASFLIFIDYPTVDFSAKEGMPVSFRIMGDARFSCKMRLIPLKGKKLPASVSVINKGRRDVQTFNGERTQEGHLEYVLQANQRITISWENVKKATRKKTKAPTGKAKSMAA